MNCLGGKDTKLLKICITATDELVKDNQHFFLYVHNQRHPFMYAQRDMYKNVSSINARMARNTENRNRY